MSTFVRTVLASACVTSVAAGGLFFYEWWQSGSAVAALTGASLCAAGALVVWTLRENPG